MLGCLVLRWDNPKHNASERLIAGRCIHRRCYQQKDRLNNERFLVAEGLDADGASDITHEFHFASFSNYNLAPAIQKGCSLITARFMDHQNQERCRRNKKTFASVTMAKRMIKSTAVAKDGVYEYRP